MEILHTCTFIMLYFTLTTTERAHVVPFLLICLDEITLLIFTFLDWPSIHSVRRVLFIVVWALPCACLDSVRFVSAGASSLESPCCGRFCAIKRAFPHRNLPAAPGSGCTSAVRYAFRVFFFVCLPASLLFILPFSPDDVSSSP
jgi:hypothetical protein